MKGRKLPRSHGNIIHDLSKRGLLAQPQLLQTPPLLLYLYMGILKYNLIIIHRFCGLNFESCSNRVLNG